MSSTLGRSVAELIDLNGGRLVGRTRLQKSAYLLECMGLGWGYEFEYHHYGPYSAELAEEIDDAKLLDFIDERSEPGSYGVPYSVFSLSSSTSAGIGRGANSDQRRSALTRMSRYSALVLEVAATAAFLRQAGDLDPWREVKLRKPQKASDERLSRARALLSELGLPT